MDIEVLLASLGVVAGIVSTAWARYQSRRTAAQAEAAAHEMARRLRNYREHRNLTPGEALSIGAAEAFGGDTAEDLERAVAEPRGSNES